MKAICNYYDFFFLSLASAYAKDESENFNTKFHKWMVKHNRT